MKPWNTLRRCYSQPTRGQQCCPLHRRYAFSKRLVDHAALKQSLAVNSNRPREGITYEEWKGQSPASAGKTLRGDRGVSTSVILNTDSRRGLTHYLGPRNAGVLVVQC